MKFLKLNRILVECKYYANNTLRKPIRFRSVESQ